MFKKNKNKYAMFIVFAILGIVIALQFRSTLYTRNQTAMNSFDSEKLVNQLAAEQNEIIELKASIEENLALREEYIRSFLEGSDAAVLPADRNEATLKAGLTSVSGPGISIVLDDAAVRKQDMPLNWLIIHDQDIKILLNELKKAGAQAISINGERITPMSEQICAGPTILINRNRYAVPYVINAIGDPEVLSTAITNSDRLAEMIEYDIRVEIVKHKEIVVPKFVGDVSLNSFISGLEAYTK